MYDNIEKLNSQYYHQAKYVTKLWSEHPTAYKIHSIFRFQSTIYFIYINLLATWIWCSFCDMVKSLALNIIINCELALPLADFSLHYHSLQSP